MRRTILSVIFGQNITGINVNILCPKQKKNLLLIINANTSACEVKAYRFKPFIHTFLIKNNHKLTHINFVMFKSISVKYMLSNSVLRVIFQKGITSVHLLVTKPRQ